MARKTYARSPLAVVAILMSFGWSMAQAAPEPAAVELPTAQFLDKPLIKGEHHKVSGQVVNEGLMNIYRIDSDFGEFSAVGDRRVAIRIQEISAIAELRKMSKTKVIAESAGQAVSKTVKSVGRAVEDPEGTLRGVGAGVGRLFKRTARRAQNTYEKVTESDDENQEQKAEDDSGDVVVEGGKKLAKSYFGVNSAVRELARDLKVDPYSDNAVLRAELESMAKVAAAGSFGTKFMIPSIPGVGVIKDVSDLVYGTSPLDLQLRNEKKLREMGVPDETVKRLFKNKFYSPTTHTRLVVSLEKLDGVAGRQIIVDEAAETQNASEADFYARIAEMFAALHANRGKLAAFVATDTVPFAMSEDGRAVLPLPVDYLRWTPNNSKAAKNIKELIDKRGAQAEAWIEGTVSDLARKEIQALDWKLTERAFEALAKTR